jgi:hypothetical protein
MSHLKTIISIGTTPIVGGTAPRFLLSGATITESPTVGASQSVRRNAANSAWEVYNTTTVPLFIGQTINSGTNGRLLYQSAGVLSQTAQLFWDGSRLGIGTSTIPTESKAYIFGGATGANLDIRANASEYDQAVVEVQASDYATNFNSAYLRYNGPGATGTTLGVANANLADLTFQSAATAVIRTLGNTTPIRIGINNTEVARFTTGGFQITGDLGVTGTRVTKGWFTNLEITNMPSVGGVAMGSMAMQSATNVAIHGGQIDSTNNLMLIIGTVNSLLIQGASVTSSSFSSNAFGGTVSGGDQNFFVNEGLVIRDTDASNFLTIKPGSNLTADRILTITTGDADRTLTLAGNATISNTNTGDQTITLTGDVTGSGTGSFATTIGANKVTLSMMATMATASILGRNTAGTGNVEVLSASTTRSLLGLVIGTNVQAWDTELDSIAGLGVVQGDIIYGSAANTYSKLAKNTTATRYLSNTGTTNNPAWAQIDLTNGVTGILTSVNGGTGNGFTKFSGPATSEKTFTLPNANATLLYDGGPLGTPSSGTLTNATGLPIGTGLSGLGAANRIPYSTSATALTTSANLTYISSQLYVGNAGASDLELRVDNGSNSFGAILTFATGNAIRAQISMANSDSNMVFRNASSVGGRSVYGFTFKNDSATVLNIDNNARVGFGGNTANWLGERITAPAVSGQSWAAAFTTNDFTASVGSGLFIGFGAASGNTYTKLQAVSSGYSANNVLILQPTGGNVKIGGTSTRATTDPVGAFVLHDATTAPVGTRTGGIDLYSTAGELRVMDAAGNATLLSPHDKEGYYIHEETNFKGRYLKIEMERLLMEVAKKLGLEKYITSRQVKKRTKKK